MAKMAGDISSGMTPLADRWRSFKAIAKAPRKPTPIPNPTKGLFLQSGAMEFNRQRTCAARSSNRRTQKLPTGFRHAGDEAVGSKLTESDTRELKTAEKCTTTARDAAPVHKARGTRVARELSEGCVVFFRYQLRTERRVFFDCFLFALVALEPCSFCHMRSILY